MNTETDIRNALQAKADEAATPEEVVLLALTHEATPRSVRATWRPRHWAAVAGSVTTVAALAVAVPVIASHTGTHRPPVHATPAPSCRVETSEPASLRSSVTFVERDPVGFDVRWACAAVQSASVTHTASHGNSSAQSEVADVNVYRPGAFDPSQVKQGRAVTVQGHRGYFGTVDFPNATPPCPVLGDNKKTCVSNLPEQSPALAWEYAKDAWAVVQSTYNPADRRPQDSFGTSLPQLLQIADGVRTDVTTPLLLPFRIRDLPDGLTATIASSGATDPGYAFVTPSLGLSLPGDNRHSPADALDCIAIGCPDLAISAEPVGGDWSFKVPPGYTPLTIAGHRARYYPHGESPGYLTMVPNLEIDINGWWVKMQVARSADSRISRQDLVRIAASLVTAKGVVDRSSWFDAATVVPR